MGRSFRLWKPDATCSRKGTVLCILYVTAAGALLGIAGLLIERALPASLPRRWIWCAVIPVSVVLPGYYRMHHNWSVTPLFQQHEGGPALRQALETASFTLFDPAWWARTESYDTAINQVWLILSGILVIWGLTNVMRVSHIVSMSRSGEGDVRQPEMIDGVPVVVTDVAGPATVGFWRSRVLVPKWVLAMPGMQRQYVLRHEEEHRRAHDARLLFVASLPLIDTPFCLFAAITLRAEASVPPIRLLLPPSNLMPLNWLPRPPEPDAVVPM